MRRLFLGESHPADWLVPLGVGLAAAAIMFAGVARAEAPYFRVPPGDVDAIRNVLVLQALAQVVATLEGAAIAAALVLAARRGDARRAAAIVMVVLVTTTLVGSGWLVPLAQRHRDDVVTRIDAATLRDAGFTSPHEPFPLSERPAAWTLPQLLQVAWGGSPDGPVDSGFRALARMHLVGTLLALGGILLPFAACWAPRRLRFAWPVILVAWVLPIAFGMLGWRLLARWLQPALERGETSAVSVALSLVPPALVGLAAFAAASRFGVPRCAAPETSKISRAEGACLAIFTLAILLTGVLVVVTLPSAVGLEEARTPEKGDALLGSPAPTLATASWLGSEAPTAESLRDHPVLVDFWGTWCGPCVRAMPHVQQIHDDFTPLGLKVIAITKEDPETVKPFLERNGYTLPVGCDTAEASVKAWRVTSWPTTYLIGRDGRVAWKGEPGDAETALMKELGLPSDPCAVLAEMRSEDGARSAWALNHLAREAPSDLDASSCGAAPGNVRDEAREELRRRHPVSSQDATLQLARGAHSTLVEQLALRGASDEVLATVTADQRLRERAADLSPDIEQLARQAVISERWVLGPRMARDQEGLWSEAQLSWMRSSCEHSGMQLRMLSVTLDGRELTSSTIHGHAHDRMAQALVLRDLAAGSVPHLADLDARAEAELARMAADADQRYGWP
jgi:thiol-disulfide isomerase/thioredoxin